MPGTDWPFAGRPLGTLARPYAAHGMRIAPVAGHPRTRIQRVAPQRRGRSMPVADRIRAMVRVCVRCGVVRTCSFQEGRR
ncbi:hypothetical protein DIE11_16260 [Burkholderia sp. Bp9012]|nr:hypothetical protein DIE11_16260 [Burkholderia sp. Bp9012]